MRGPRSAIILAAGRGLRLGPRGLETPKGLLLLDRVPLVVRSVEILRQHGVADIKIVAGHLYDQYAEVIRRWATGVELVYNSDFATTGSAKSLAVGMAAARGDVLVLESDLVFERSAIASVLDAAEESLVLTSGPTGAGDEVWVWDRPIAGQPCLAAISKNRTLSADEPYGEFVGITKLSARFSKTLAKELSALLSHDVRADYETALSMAASIDGLPLLRVERLLWAEIDDENMYARTVREVWPRILRQDIEDADRELAPHGSGTSSIRDDRAIGPS